MGPPGFLTLLEARGVADRGVALGIAPTLMPALGMRVDEGVLPTLTCATAVLLGATTGGKRIIFTLLDGKRVGVVVPLGVIDGVDEGVPLGVRLSLCVEESELDGVPVRERVGVSVLEIEGVLDLVREDDLDELGKGVGVGVGVGDIFGLGGSSGLCDIGAVRLVELVVEREGAAVGVRDSL